MSNYLGNSAFGCGAFDLTGITAADGKIYAGQGEGAKTTEADATAIELSKWLGNYKDRAWIRLTTVTEITGPTYIIFKFVYLKTSTAAGTAAICEDTHKMLVSKVNEAKTTPIEFSLPSVGGDARFVRMEISAPAKVTAGAVLATVEQTRL